MSHFKMKNKRFTLKVSYYEKSTFERFSINNTHPQTVYNPPGVKNIPPAFTFNFFRNACFEQVVWDLVCRSPH